MKLYKHTDTLTYGSVCKYFPSLYNKILAEYGNSTLSIQFSKAHYNHDNEDCFKNHIVIMGLLAKYVTNRSLIKHGTIYFYEKIERISFHLSARIPFPAKTKIIPMKRMYIKLGKIRVSYKESRIKFFL